MVPCGGANGWIEGNRQWSESVRETSGCLRSSRKEGGEEEPRVPPLEPAEEAGTIQPPPAPPDLTLLLVEEGEPTSTVVLAAAMLQRSEDVKDAVTEVHHGVEDDVAAEEKRRTSAVFEDGGPTLKGEFGSVLAIPMNPKLDVLGECIVEFVVVILVLRNLKDHLNAFLHQILPDHFENLVLLERLTGNVEWEIIRVYNALHEAEILRDEFLTIVHDEDPPHIEFDVVELFFGVKEIKGCSSWNKQNGLEFQLAFHREVLHYEMVLPVIW